MVNKEKLLQQLVESENQVKLFVNFSKDSLFINRIKKFLHHPIKVARVILYKAKVLKAAEVSFKMFWNRKIVLPLWDENALIAYYTGGFGLAETFLVRYLIMNIKSDDVFYDIGSSFGLYTVLGEELTSHVYSFEPNPHTVKYILRNAKTSTKVEAVAVSDTKGVVDLYDTFDSNKSGMSSLFPDIAAGTVAGTYKAIPVSTITLDDYIGSHEVPSMIKMDVMNADYIVLKGGKRLFTEYSPVLALRMYNTPKAIERTKMSLALLKEYGYFAYSINEKGELISVDIKPEALKFATTYIFKK